MHSHLDIQINGQSLVLPDDFSLSVSEQNPMFNDVTFFSYPASIPTKGNLSVLKNIAHRDSSMRAMDLEHADSRIYADGLPLNNGQVITQDGSEIGPTFEFNIDAQRQSFSELIGDLECQDVKVKDELLIGRQIGRTEVTYSCVAQNWFRSYQDGVLVSEGVVVDYFKPGWPKEETLDEGQIMMEAPQALGFSVPLNINVSQPYPFPYCNGRVCYAHPDGEGGIVKGNSQSSVDGHDFGQYWVLPANRPQSGICFYVLYFLDCLFEQLGVTFDNSELLAVEDFKRLCFFTTQCKYELRETGTVLGNINAINQWLTDNGCGGLMQVVIKSGDREIPLIWDGQFNINEPYAEGLVIGGRGTYYDRRMYGYVHTESRINEMYASSGNFPNASVSSVISSLENSFGIRFLYDPEKRLVKACLLRETYNRKDVKLFQGKVLSMTPVNEKITGARMAYSAESESKEQQKNIRNGVKDYDTEYDYIEYPENRTILNLHYGDIAKQVSATNMNVYVDLATGNSYRVKIDKPEEDSVSLRPVLFQVAQNKGIEVGDCSERNKDFVKEFVSDFQPLSVNVVNAKDYTNNTNGSVSPILAPFLDVEMEREYEEKKIQQLIFQDMKFKELLEEKKQNAGGFDTYTTYIVPWPNGVEMLLTQKLYLAESYDPTQTESGNSPLQDIDWGLTIGIMRGAGSNSEVIEYDYNYDWFGNSRWKDTVATYELTSDTMDLKGAIFDYNGSEPGDGGGERFSLQIRSWASFVYYIDGDGKLHINKDVSLAGKAVEGASQYTWQIPCDDDERDLQGNVINKIRSRGLFDTFMREHVLFLLNRKKYKVKVLATIAQLLDIRNHWNDFYALDGKVGLIDKVNYEIYKSEGVKEAELEFYSY